MIAGKKSEHIVAFNYMYESNMILNKFQSKCIDNLFFYETPSLL